MPEMLKVIAAKNQVTINTKLIAHGGYALKNHLKDGFVDKALDSISWDFVVLNEQSMLGTNYVVDGINRIRESPSFYNAVREFDLKIRKNGGKTVIISLYPRNLSPINDIEILKYSYMKIAKELKIILSPVSYAWNDILKSENKWLLYKEDNIHPTPLGSFITASVLYSTITQRKSKVIVGEIKGNLIDELDGVIYQDSVVRLLKIDKLKSKLINDIAYKNVDNLIKAGGYYQLKMPK